MTNQDNVLKQMNRSGFPFQLRVEEEIRRTHSIHNWSVASREHPWTNPETDISGFIDIVLKHDDFSTFRVVIECKRMKSDDARHLQWLFLMPDQDMSPVKLATCLEVEGGSYEEVWQDIRVWEDVLVNPLSLQSEFCVLPNDEQRRQPILESLTAEVLDSIEGLAQEEVRIEQSQYGPNHLRLFLFPTIVTNAEIIACRFNSEEIKIVDGTLEASNVTFQKVPFIRFRKSVVNDFPEGRFLDLRTAQRARERTIFIVNAEAIAEFLSNWQVDPLNMEGFAIQKHKTNLRERR